MKKKPTMTDIARLAGVSQATVSFVLGDSKNTKITISESTKEKVIIAARQLNYRPNEAAVALVTGRFSCIQLFISDVTDPFFGELIRGVEDEARSRKYRMFLRSTHFSNELELQSFSDLDNYMVDGVIVCGSNIPKDEMSRQAEIHKIVFINERNFMEGGQIHIDDTAGFVSAITVLKSLGHVNFDYVSTPMDRITSNNRLSSFLEAVKLSELNLDQAKAIHYASLPGFDGGLELGIQLGQRYSTMENSPSVIFCFNDLIALGVIKGLQSTGISVPETISVIGFDNIDTGRMATPALSTINVPRYDIGRMAMSMVEDMIEETDREPRLINIQPVFLPRESHGIYRKTEIQ